MDAITLLRTDHKTIEKLFKEFEKAGPTAYKTKRHIVDRMIEQLSIHAAIEEQHFYPSVKERVEEQDGSVLEALEEHHIVKWVLSELDGTDPTDERFDAKVTVLVELVRHHVEEEEQQMFPAVRNALGRKELSDLGEAMAEAKEIAPLRPHPRSPNQPPANLITGALAGTMDRIREAVTPTR
jgi:hemerythrin superfamily protein